MTMIDGPDLALKILLFGWFGYAAYSHFSRSSKEGIGTIAVKLTSVAGLACNTWLFFSITEDRYGGIGLIATFVSGTVFFRAIQSSKAAGLAAAFSKSTSVSLVLRGIYRFVRHPFYLSYLVYWLSWCLSLGFRGLSVVVFLTLLALYVLSIRLEETELERDFGDEYREYRKRTSILLPYIL